MTDETNRDMNVLWSSRNRNAVYQRHRRSTSDKSTELADKGTNLGFY